MEQTPAVVPDAGVMGRIRSEIASAKGWLKFLGVLTLIYGILTALALVGILFIIIGLIMIKAGSRGADYVERGDLEGLVEYHSKLKTYFTISGVLAIIALAGGAIGLIVSIIVLLTTGF
ncbi:hypothetical protein JXM67_14060 [candidate division WOR-3 bacterium]|nr:hypothetical protein [candidate division WOR-3 bacterium]